MSLWLSRWSRMRGRGMLLPGDVFFQALRSGVPVLRGGIKARSRLVCRGKNRLSVRRTLICGLARCDFRFPCCRWGSWGVLRFGRVLLLLRSCALIGGGALLGGTGLSLALRCLTFRSFALGGFA